MDLIVVTLPSKYMVFNLNCACNFFSILVTIFRQHRKEKKPVHLISQESFLIDSGIKTLWWTLIIRARGKKQRKWLRKGSPILQAHLVTNNTFQSTITPQFQMNQKLNWVQLMIQIFYLTTMENTSSIQKPLHPTRLLRCWQEPHSPMENLWCIEHWIYPSHWCDCELLENEDKWGFIP